MDDQDFEPLLGRRRHATRGRSKVRAGDWLIRSEKRPALSKKAQSAPGRFGRGAVIGSLFAQRAAYKSPASHRVIVKIRIVQTGTRAGLRGISHMRYLERDGLDRSGNAPRSYSASMDKADKTGFFAGTEDDRRHFHIVVSPEDGDQLASLKSYVRGFMAQVAEDLGTDLEWLATDHFNTGQPHSHILLRGITETGAPLLIAKDYMQHGFRGRASEQMRLQLGQHPELESIRTARHETELARPIGLDRKLLEDRSASGAVSATHDDPFEQALRTRRLQTLEMLGIAEPQGALVWRLDEDMLDQLIAVQKQSARIDHLREIVAALGQNRGAAEYRLLEAGDVPMTGVIGSLLGVPGRTLADEGADLLVDSIDGRIYSVEKAALGDNPAMLAGMIVQILPQPISEGRGVAQNGLSHHDGLRLGIKILSYVPLTQLPHYDGPTWLDELTRDSEMPPIRDMGFGKELRAARGQRQQWLIEQGLDGETAGASSFPALRQRELLRVAGAASEEGLDVAHHDGFIPASGRFHRQVILPRGRFALFEHGFQFRLVPWEPAFEKLAKPKPSGLGIDDSSPDWPTGRSRHGPTIS